MVKTSRNQARKIFGVIMVFLSGYVTAINLSGIIFGSPEHYDAAAWKVVLALLFGVVFGIRVVKGE